MGEVIRTYKTAIGGNPIGAKKSEAITRPRRKPTSSIKETARVTIICLFIFPIQTRMTKCEQKSLGVSPGGDIMIHGIKNGLAWAGASHAEFDWTKGCIAVTNEEMEELYKLVPNGTIIEIRP